MKTIDCECYLRNFTFVVNSISFQKERRFIASRLIAILTLMIGAIQAVAPSAAAEGQVSDLQLVMIEVEEDGRVHSIEGISTGPVGRAAGERAPDCINAVGEKGFVQVYNNCPFDLRVKVIFAFNLDSSCKLVVAGTRTNISPHKARIDGVQLC